MGLKMRIHAVVLLEGEYSRISFMQREGDRAEFVTWFKTTRQYFGGLVNAIPKEE